ncbi:SDR family oxidoreductase [Acidimangrovimonas sediminis]|uniref:SDR family oxidoreductase n=1 Tax=Acidimangrovimonas sediminis TaxID=2056283 RepID=UPI000C80E95F|nr:SDR family oxidoreductase [Acidimangrovimonas sediminis]
MTEFKAAYVVAGVPVGRIGRPEDIARAALFFASDGNDYFTGQLLYICGGRSLFSVGL